MTSSAVTPARGEWRPVEVRPVARVAVDVPLAHLDRPFDYRVPAHLDTDARPGVRVRVRFAGRMLDGYLLERVADSEHEGTLAWIDKVVSPEPALSPEVAALCRVVADRYAGVFADVVRLAVPPRHARVEKEPPRPRSPAPAGCPPGAGAPAPPPSASPAPARSVPGPPALGRNAPSDAAVSDAAVSDAAVSDAARSDAAPSGGAASGGAACGVATTVTTEPGVGWGRYARGPALLDALAGGRAAHAVWQALPGERWAERLAEAAAATAGAERGSLLVVPDQRDVDAVAAACVARLGTDAVVALTAELGPAERYRRWLAVRRGEVRVVVGTRSAAFAPVADPGLLVVWDDGDDLHAEPRAPYPHVRDVLVLRAHAAGAALLVGGYARTAEAQLLVESGWAREVVADRAAVRAAMPRVVALGETNSHIARDPDARAARLPHVAFEAAHAALDAGRPVLVQVPRSGYVPWLACGTCRETARCRHCAGPLGLRRGGAGPAVGARSEGGPTGVDGGAGARGDDGSAASPYCRWCGRPDPAFRCAACGSRRLRAGVVGSGRTAEELGRAFPGVPVRSSGGGAVVLAEVPAGPALVVATPGAEPPADGGYGAALLLDGWAMLSRPDLRVGEETLRRWLAAAALVVPHTDGGRVVITADSALPGVQALVRWDPAGHAATELASRAEVGFPPAVRMAAVEGAAASVAHVVDEVVAALHEVEVLGPVEVDPPPDAPDDDPVRERALLRVPRAQGRALAAALHAAQAARTARKAADPVRVRLDPAEIG